jgi:cytosine/uracil/thiamine/allantoin permease
MKIMGLANWLHWTAWLVKCLMFLLITITCMLLMLTVSYNFDLVFFHFKSLNCRLGSVVSRPKSRRFCPFKPSGYMAVPVYLQFEYNHILLHAEHFLCQR